LKAGELLDWLNGETVSIILFFIGLYGVIARRNVIKTIISIGIMQTSVIIFFITMNYEGRKIPPVNITNATTADNLADPLPQALMITAIVIGVAFTAVSLTMFINLYHKYGTKHWGKIAERRMEGDND
jgi:multicomponent Na+:H+ antiporter subunit C